MPHLRRLIWHIASRLLVLTLVLGLLITGFYYAMNMTNIYIVLKDGMARRAQVVMHQEDEKELNKYKKGGEFEGMFPERWLPSTFAILPEPFTEQNQMINSTMKMVRGKIEKFYADRIEFLYSAEGKQIFNEKNLEKTT